MQELVGTHRLLVYQVRPLRQQMKEISLDDIITDHSLFPIMKPFTTNEWYAKTIEEVKKGKLTVRLDRNQEFKVCPCCYMDDMKELGQAYLRREHQVEGNLICLQHNIDLKRIKRHKSKDSQELFTSDLTSEELEVSHVYNDSLYWKISEMIHSIFKDKVLDNMDLKKVQERYRERLRELGYADDKYVISQEKLAKVIGEYYGDRLAVLLDEELEINKRWNWIVSITTEHFRVKPIAHLLMICFLFGGIEEFINYRPKISTNQKRRRIIEKEIGESLGYGNTMDILEYINRKYELESDNEELQMLEKESSEIYEEIFCIEKQLEQLISKVFRDYYKGIDG